LRWMGFCAALTKPYIIYYIRSDTVRGTVLPGASFDVSLDCAGVTARLRLSYAGRLASTRAVDLGLTTNLLDSTRDSRVARRVARARRAVCCRVSGRDNPRSARRAVPSVCRVAITQSPKRKPLPKPRERKRENGRWRGVVSRAGPRFPRSPGEVGAESSSALVTRTTRRASLVSDLTRMQADNTVAS
jgi:hypothetical protein